MLPLGHPNAGGFSLTVHEVPSMPIQSSPPASEVWEQQPVIAAAMLGALREHPLTQNLSEAQLMMLVERALRDRCRGDFEWLTQMVPRIMAGENLLESAPAPELAADDKIAATKVHPNITLSRPLTVHSQEELNQSLEQHRLWIKHVLEPGQDIGPGRANFKAGDLRGFNLDAADLRAAHLEGCNLSGVSLINANLAGAKLAHAKLEGACLEGSRLRRADLTGADLRGAKLRAADLRHAILKGAQLQDADMTDVLGWTGLETASKPNEL